LELLDRRVDSGLVGRRDDDFTTLLKRRFSGTISETCEASKPLAMTDAVMGYYFAYLMSLR
jgi:hypothetical protein